MSDTADTRGFSLVELLVAVAVIGILAAIVAPRLMDALDRSRQRRTMADMRAIATANGARFVDHGAYAGDLEVLRAQGYMVTAPESDAWGNGWIYTSDGNTYSLTSLGSDGALGPPAPSLWINEPYEPDIELQNGVFEKAPTGQ